MGKRTHRWAIWKIGMWTAVCAVLCPALLWLSTVADELLSKPSRAPGGRAPAMSISSVLIMFAAAAALLAILGAIWLVARIRDARTPAWKKGGSKKRF